MSVNIHDPANAQVIAGGLAVAPPLARAILEQGSLRTTMSTFVAGALIGVAVGFIVWGMSLAQWQKFAAIAVSSLLSKEVLALMVGVGSVASRKAPGIADKAIDRAANSAGVKSDDEQAR